MTYWSTCDFGDYIYSAKRKKFRIIQALWMAISEYKIGLKMPNTLQLVATGQKNK